MKKINSAQTSGRTALTHARTARFAVNRETLRVLSSMDLELVSGGGGADTSIIDTSPFAISCVMA
jgi:hypothetical protein